MEVEEDKEFSSDTETVKAHEFCATIIPFNIKRKGFIDLTGSLPHKSSRGNLYAMILYEYDSNEILAKPIKNIQAATIYDDFLNIHIILKSRGSNPSFYIMDNGCYSDLKEYMKKYTIDFQLTPPHMQRRNEAERAIITSRNHLISGLAMTYPDPPIIQCDQLLPQCLITLNLLHNSRVDTYL